MYSIDASALPSNASVSLLSILSIVFHRPQHPSHQQPKYHFQFFLLYSNSIVSPSSLHENVFQFFLLYSTARLHTDTASARLDLSILSIVFSQLIPIALAKPLKAFNSFYCIRRHSIVALRRSAASSLSILSIVFRERERAKTPPAGRVLSILSIVFRGLGA